MYSKAGIISVEMFPWLQQKDAILSNKSPGYHLPQYGDIPHSISNRVYKFKELIQSTSQTKQEQPFFKQVGRKNPKRDPDRYGFYQPKYNLVFRRSPLDEDSNIKNQMDRSIPKQSAIKQQNDIRKDQSFPKPLKKPKGYVEIGKQRITEKFPLPQGPHESRFEYIQFPQSQYPRTQKIIIKEKDQNAQQQQQGQFYDINYSAIYAKSDKLIPSFNKTTGRSPLTREPYTMNESFSDRSFTSNKSLEMDKQISREKALSLYNQTRRLYYQ